MAFGLRLGTNLGCGGASYTDFESDAPIEGLPWHRWIERRDEGLIVLCLAFAPLPRLPIQVFSEVRRFNEKSVRFGGAALDYVSQLARVALPWMLR